MSTIAPTRGALDAMGRWRTNPDLVCQRQREDQELDGNSPFDGFCYPPGHGWISANPWLVGPEMSNIELRQKLVNCACQPNRARFAPLLTNVASAVRFLPAHQMDIHTMLCPPYWGELYRIWCSACDGTSKILRERGISTNRYPFPADISAQNCLGGHCSMRILCPSWYVKLVKARQQNYNSGNSETPRKFTE